MLRAQLESLRSPRKKTQCQCYIYHDQCASVECRVLTCLQPGAGWLCQAMTGGVDWNDLANPLETSISPIMSLAGKTQIHKKKAVVVTCSAVTVRSYDAKLYLAIKRKGWLMMYQHLQSICI